MNILIVGATQGIGLGFVREFLKLDKVDRVYATYLTEAAAGELLAIDDDRLSCFQLDLTIESEIERVISQIKERVTSLDYTINCVGILHDRDGLQPEKSLRHINSERLLQYFQINAVTAILLAKHLQPLLKQGDRSILATISAKVGSIGDNQLGGWYGYRAAKSALNMLMKTTAIEFKRTCPKAIVVNLHPGTTDTRLSLPFQQNVPAEKLFTIDRTASQLIAVIDKLTPADSGEFFNWDGSKLPW
jgi:NAD(P)-dependent dehydrogenase (short-subunit alcohol dehydrogenase family)